MPPELISVLRMHWGQCSFLMKVPIAICFIWYHWLLWALLLLLNSVEAAPITHASLLEQTHICIRVGKALPSTSPGPGTTRSISHHRMFWKYLNSEAKMESFPLIQVSVIVLDIPPNDVAHLWYVMQHGWRYKLLWAASQLIPCKDTPSASKPSYNCAVWQVQWNLICLFHLLNS